MTYRQFTTKYNGRFVDFDKHYGAQCVDLMRQYLVDVCGVSGYTIPPTDYAKNIFKNFPDKGTAQFEKIYNSPTNTPKQGDIIFWGYYPTVTGIAGHVAIVEAADLYYVYTFGQNYPTGNPSIFRKFGSSPTFHGYRGVLGWLRRK